MMNENEMNEFVDWLDNTEFAWSIPGNYVDNEFWKIVDGDRDGLEKYMNKMDPESLSVISGFFDDMYGKWPDKKMEKLIKKLRKKIIDAGLQP